jgi:heme o synthase
MNATGTSPVRSTGMKIRSYIELMKPELTGLSTLTTLCGFYLGAASPLPVWKLVATGIGALLVGGSAGAFNEYIERDYDAMMKRTERRPLPTGRLVPAEGLIFALSGTIAGLACLWLFTNLLTVVLAFVTWMTYVGVYTPMKRMTPLATLVGGIPGAIPPMMGWAAARNSLSPEAWILFVILFCWQMPHFFALAWMYRKDYARAGFKILTVADSDGRRTARQILFYCLALLPASIAPTWIGLTGHLTFAAAILMGVSFAWLGFLLMMTPPGNDSDPAGRRNFLARKVFMASLVYLPALLLFMIVDKV